MGKVTWKGGLALLLLLMAIVLAGCGPQLADAGWAAFNADATTVYVGLPSGKFTALNAESGLLRWEFPQGNSRLAGFYSTPALTSGLVLVGANDPTTHAGRAFALDPANGSQRWAFTQPKDLVVGDLTVSNGTVYVTSADHNVYALDVQTGAPRWPAPFTADGPVWSGVAIQGDRLFVGSMSHSLYALSPADGKQIWRFNTQGAVPGTPAAGEGLVYAGDLSGTLFAVNAQSGQEVWRFKAQNWIWGQPALVAGKLYVSSLDNRVYQLDAKTGQQGWTFQAKGAVRAGPTFANGLLYVASEDQNLYAVDANTGNQVWAFNAGGPLLTSPVVVNGTVYVTSSSGKAFALDAKAGTQRWVYPQPTK